MLGILDFSNLEPEIAKEKINQYKDSNPSLANMIQSMLNKREQKEGLPLTKIVEPIQILTKEEFMEGKGRVK